MKLNHFSSKKLHPLWLFSFLLCLLLANETYAQSLTTITGKITDNAGLPIPGANIIEKGTNNSSSTDFDGKFAIKVSNLNTTLTVS